DVDFNVGGLGFIAFQQICHVNGIGHRNFFQGLQRQDNSVVAVGNAGGDNVFDYM
ncbi:MAG: hypothetical protein JRI93_15005, partial [Deltaproteobacteria bacterium]|nr:hypothetical protein [Deltaproteobacteria bacterium]